VVETGETGSEPLPVGMVGLGNMGSALAANLVESGRSVVAYDSAGPGRAPQSISEVGSLAEVVRQSGVVVMSLPDGIASEEVARAILGVSDRRTSLVLDTSTIGVRAAERIGMLLEQDGVEYVDAPVSGGVAGARARTLMVMFAGTALACARATPVLAALSDRRRRVGDRPGMAQALKLANNFLSATALAATSEAVSFGCSVGIEMETMLEVLNMSSGQSAATTDKFPNQIANGRYGAGFTNTLMSKDVGLYLRAAEEQGTSSVMGRVTADVWGEFATKEPGADFTRIFPFVEGS
jgi:3-hydroxyisobutyrate dehydrogenase-like beta-hydroxyacid dehydrogenase